MAISVKGFISNNNDLNKKLLIARLKVIIKQEYILKIYAEVKTLLYFMYQRLK